MLKSKHLGIYLPSVFFSSVNEAMIGNQGPAVEAISIELTYPVIDAHEKHHAHFREKEDDHDEQPGKQIPSAFLKPETQR